MMMTEHMYSANLYFDNHLNWEEAGNKNKSKTLEKWSWYALFLAAEAGEI